MNGGWLGMDVLFGDLSPVRGDCWRASSDEWMSVMFISLQNGVVGPDSAYAGKTVGEVGME